MIGKPEELVTYWSIVTMWSIIRSWFNSVKWFIQRGRRGWADCDTWELDGYLSRVLAGSLVHLAEYTHGSPCIYEGAEDVMQFTCRNGEVRCPCELQWAAELYQHAALFWRLGNGDYDDLDEEEAAQEEAVIWLAKRWGHLWD